MVGGGVGKERIVEMSLCEPSRKPPQVCAELVEVDPEDEGPTLVVLVKGRPPPLLPPSSPLHRPHPHQPHPKHTGGQRNSKALWSPLVLHVCALCQEPQGVSQLPNARLSVASLLGRSAVISAWRVECMYFCLSCCFSLSLCFFFFLFFFFFFFFSLPWPPPEERGNRA